MGKASQEIELLFSIPNDMEAMIERYKDLPSIERLAQMSDTMERNLYVTDIVTDELVQYGSFWIRRYNKLDEMMNTPVEERKPIMVHINTLGGELGSAMNFIDLISLSKTPVHTVVYDCAYSAGGLILMNGHKRFSYPCSSFLLHSGNAGAINTTDKFLDLADFYKKVEKEKVKPMVLKKTTISEELYDKNFRVDWFLDAQEMLNYGIIDEILTEII